MALTNWTLGQPLATAPGSEYAPTDDGYRVLQYIVEKARGVRRGGERACGTDFWRCQLTAA